MVFLKKALLISSSAKSADSLCEMLRSEKYVQIAVSENAADAKKLAENEEYDLICINAPLSEESGINLSEYFARTTRASVVIIVPQKNADEINDILTEHGVLVISKPINRHLFHHFLQFTECFKRRILSVTKENEELKHMVEDLKIIDRAKFLLITCLNMDEKQAHRYLEKQAMDLRIGKLQVAKQVIKTYEN